MKEVTKKEGRIICHEQRKSLSPGLLREYSEQICTLLFSNFNFEGKKISLFLPIESKKEVDTYIILEKALSLNAIVGIPKANFEKFDLKHYIFQEPTQLEISAFGIPEPRYGRLISATSFDYVIVPLLGFDKRGYRIGYGKGFYDRFLAKCNARAQFIGISIHAPFEKISDVESSDMKLHACITPDSIFRF